MTGYTPEQRRADTLTPVVGDAFQARATHQRRSLLRVSALCVGIAIAGALSACAACDDPGGQAVYRSMRDHPEEWYWDGFYFHNASKGVDRWNNDLWVWTPPHPFTTIGCRAAINEVSAPIRDRSRREASVDLANEFAASAGEAGTAETPKSGSARRASTRRLKAGTPK